MALGNCPDISSVHPRLNKLDKQMQPDLLTSFVHMLRKQTYTSVEAIRAVVQSTIILKLTR